STIHNIPTQFIESMLRKSLDKQFMYDLYCFIANNKYESYYKMINYTPFKKYENCYLTTIQYWSLYKHINEITIDLQSQKYLLLNLIFSLPLSPELKIFFCVTNNKKIYFEIDANFEFIGGVIKYDTFKIKKFDGIVDMLIKQNTEFNSEINICADYITYDDYIDEITFKMNDHVMLVVDSFLFT